MGRLAKQRIASSSSRRRAGVVLASAVVLVTMAAACGSSKGASAGGGSASDGLASLKVISTDVTVHSGPDGSASSAGSGQGLAVGDTVATDSAGFAEVGFFDGSLTRVDHAASFTIVDLQDPEASKVVHTNLTAGRSWNRIDELSESQTWETDTPVASATVRGTAFSADCVLDVPNACRFAVVDGTVELGLPDGSKVTLEAGQEATVVKDAPPPQPVTLGVPVLLTDAWIARNVALDTDGGKLPLETASAPGPNDGQYVLTATQCESVGDLEGAMLTLVGETVVLSGGGDPLVMTAQPTDYDVLTELQVQLDPSQGFVHREFVNYAFTATGGGIVLADHASAGSDPCRNYVGHRVSTETQTTDPPPGAEHCDELEQQVSALVAADGRVNGSVFNCLGGWAVGSSQTPEGDEGTDAYRWGGAAWESADRSQACEQRQVPPELFLAVCYTN